MNAVIERTGGDFVKVTDRRSAGFSRIDAATRLRYTLQYAMPKGKSGEERAFKVLLSEDAQARNPEARVRARTGYRMPQRYFQVTSQ